jgi:hypothetical protein
LFDATNTLPELRNIVSRITQRELNAELDARELAHV